MVQQITVDGHKQLAITMKGLNNLSDLVQMQSALTEVLDTCLSSDEAKQGTSSFALWFLLQLIKVLSSDILTMQQAEGGEV